MKFNTNSNAYTIVYASIMVIIVAFLLAFISSVLKSTQEANVANDKRSQILAALNLRDVENVEQKYNETILKALVVNVEGEVIDSVGGFDVESKMITAKNDHDKKLPLYVAKVGADTLYVVPLFGRGLWGGISGYLALKKDLNTVYGCNYTHESETAGLGARIVELEFQQKFTDKQAHADTAFTAVALGMKKKVENPKTEVDMITGATLTCDGMDAMFKTSLSPYKKYFIANHK
ncbi:NADH:ubiquinone reductase (Na(+)-transporting) subunit C [Alloprevotella sp. OH1205_COT-284]|uniref:NADH:ubiquinone reductase (Na(+)-transporting) subunit C n=1 Tax=Alloprevotella sp. OH1205_COT-284 TaxID=2491043 RepID=UPI000F5FC7CA|nr:NADH:ubiquinone reductase (Na(+)-transporting) subunit C [Alloprevotella sp. OH1205_COT-284]RRD77029.1 NADH:ubiquinone reductase (Na(+)-transporting) subunit C [Alloprevotella sp. OH1205_COT-284]